MVPEPDPDYMPRPGIDYFPPYLACLMTDSEKNVIFPGDFDAPRFTWRIKTDKREYEVFLPLTSLDSFKSKMESNRYLPQELFVTFDFFRSLGIGKGKLEEEIKKTGWDKGISNGAIELITDIHLVRP